MTDHERLMHWARLGEQLREFRGERALAASVLALTTELQVRYAFVSERMQHDARALVVADRKNLQQPFSYQYDAPGSPCRSVYAGEVLAMPCDVSKRFPGEDAEAYVGVPLKSASGEVIGVLAVLHDHALPVARLEPVTWTLRSMAPRVAAELECLRLSRAPALQPGG